ncbi:DUF6895 family protein [Haliscomenobacter sp.]|uniref:DUF6895 family protein n=1 Tax=Haliscomenobacter sp. TaxID=2717303 RepID=UPI003BAA1D72
MNANEQDFLPIWVKANLNRFRLSNQESLDLFSAAKPLGELCLVLIGIKNCGISDLNWAKELIQCLWLDLVELNRQSYWTRLWKKIDEQDVYGEILQLFLHLELLCGHRFTFHKQIRDYLQGVSSRPSIALSLRYTCELIGEGSCERYALEEIGELLSRQERGETLYSSDLYDLTHAIFYGSKMGTRSLKWKGVFPELPEVLNFYMQNSLESSDLDLAAELLFSLVLLKTTQSRIAEKTYQRLKENIQPDLNSPLIVGNLFYEGDQFNRQYHLALVTILSLYTMK